MQLQRCYQLLGARPDWTIDEIKGAFRRQLLTVHPDQNPKDPLAVERTRQLLEAYRTVLRYASTSPRLCHADTSVAHQMNNISWQAQNPRQFWFSRASDVVFICTVVALAVYLILNVLLSERGPVFRPNPSAFVTTEPVKELPIVAEPDITDTSIWYYTRRYQSTLGDEWLCEQAIEAYRHAAAQAAILGDTDRLTFFRVVLKQIKAAKRLPCFPSLANKGRISSTN
jgi:hypothetical protein